MNTGRLSTLTMLIALSAAPLVAQQPGSRGGMMMGQGMASMCSMPGMMGQGSMMGHPGMMGQSSMMGHPGMMSGPGMMMSGGMMGGAGASASALLAAGDHFDLTEDQKASLEELSATAADDWRAHMQAAMAARQEAAGALQGDAPDLEAYESALNEAAGQMVEAQVARTRASLEARNVLNPEQRAKLDDELSLLGSMICGAMGSQGMGQGSGGMGHGLMH